MPNITLTLTNLTSSPASPISATTGDNITITLTPSAGFFLPAKVEFSNNITVKSYSQQTGVITLLVPVADATIIAVGSSSIDRILISQATYIEQTDKIKNAIINTPIVQPSRYVQYAETVGNKIIFHNYGGVVPLQELTLQGLPTTVANTYLHADASGNLEWATSSGGTWGSITGTLSNQTDLQEALNNKISLLGTEAGSGEQYHFPYHIGDLRYDSSDRKIKGSLYTITLDNNKTLNSYPLEVELGITKANVGLGNVDNTSDANKPISTATQTALNSKVTIKTTIDDKIYAYAFDKNGEKQVDLSTIGKVTGVKGDSEATYRTGEVNITKANIGLGNVVDTGDSDTPVSGGITKFTTGGAYTELNKKVDKTDAVTAVSYDTTNKKITKTINGTTSDVVSASALKTDMALNNVTNDAQLKASDKVTSLSSSSTDTEIPSAKIVYTSLTGKQDTLTTAQIGACNSGITSTKVGTYDGYATSKQDKLPTVTNDRYLHTNSSTGALEWAQVDLSGKQDKVVAGTAGNLMAFSGTAGTINAITPSTSISSSSTDTQIPTAKAVYSYIESLDADGTSY